MDEVERSPQFLAAVERAKLEALYQFAYGAGHDINNPLANIATRAQSLLAGEPQPERRRMLAAIHAQAMRAHEMLGDLMLFARPPTPEWAVVKVAALVEQAIAQHAPSAQQQGTRLESGTISPDLTCEGDLTQLAVALAALVTNALEAVGEGGRIAIEAAGEPSSGRVEIVVRDTGPGIDPAIRPHLFDPFFSGREAGRGLGFGLCKCWRIIDLHGGAVEVESPPTGGAVFRLKIPAKRRAE